MYKCKSSKIWRRAHPNSKLNIVQECTHHDLQFDILNDYRCQHVFTKNVTKNNIQNI